MIGMITNRQLALINKINEYVESEEDDLYLDFDDYRELNEWLQKSLKLKDLARELYNIADMLCDRMTDFPAGCDACSLLDEDYYMDDNGDIECDYCEYNAVRRKYEEVMR